MNDLRIELSEKYTFLSDQSHTLLRHSAVFLLNGSFCRGNELTCVAIYIVFLLTFLQQFINLCKGTTTI